MSSALDVGIDSLQNDFTNGARVLATNALITLKSVLLEKERQIDSSEALWTLLTSSSRSLIAARPSMAAAITTAILKALSSIQEAWEEHPGPVGSFNQADLLREIQIAASMLDTQIQIREKSTDNLKGIFTRWLLETVKHFRHERPIRILTLSHSSSLSACLVDAIGSHPIDISLYILESRPRCEGAAFASSLSTLLESAVHDKRVSIEVNTDASVATIAQNVDIVLLGADRISGDGDVSNKTGSLAAAVCTKTLSPGAKVVVVSESDKVAKLGAMSEHVVEDNDREEVWKYWDEQAQTAARDSDDGKGFVTRNVYFEWVPSQWIDTYVCETGEKSREDINRVSTEIGEMEKKIFGNDKVQQ